MPERLPTQTLESENRSDLKKILKKITSHGTLFLALNAGLDMGYLPRGEKRQSMEEKADMLSAKYGSRAPNPKINKYERALEDVRLESKEEATIDTIRTSTQIINEKVMRSILETYPKGWVIGELSAISVKGSPSTDRAGEQYGLPSGTIIATTGSSSLTNRSRIHFYSNSMVRLSNEVIIHESLSHELAHANDWEHDNELSVEDRVSLMAEIDARLDSPERHMSAYVESINNSEDIQKERYFKAKEYWAEICGQFFSDPENLHIDDYLLVKKYVEKNEAGFNEDASNDLRRSIVDDNENTEDSKRYRYFKKHMSYEGYETKDSSTKE